MVLDLLDMNHTNYDLEWSPTTYNKERISTAPNLEGAIEDFNLNSQLESLKLELPKTEEQQEKEVLELIKVRWLKTSFENNRFTQWVNVNKIQDWVFNVVSNKNWNVNYFVDEKWEVLFWIVALSERFFVKNWKAFELAWYIEKKEGELYNMYKLIDWVEQWPIDINSQEYYKAWQDIIFYANMLSKLLIINNQKFDIKESEGVDIKELISVFISWWSFKFEDLELFKSEWIITQEIFDYWISEMQKIIVSQCIDERLINMVWENGESLGIKESDLKRYLENWYINPEMANECYQVLPDNMKDLSKY